MTLSLPARGRTIEGYRAAEIVGGLCDAVEGTEPLLRRAWHLSRDGQKQAHTNPSSHHEEHYWPGIPLQVQLGKTNLPVAFVERLNVIICLAKLRLCFVSDLKRLSQTAAMLTTGE